MWVYMLGPIVGEGDKEIVSVFLGLEVDCNDCLLLLLPFINLSIICFKFTV